MSNLGIDLLSLWWSVGWEAMELCETVERLPEACKCGEAEAHLEGRCRCCSGHEPLESGPAREANCLAIIARLQTDLTILAKDFASAAGPVEAVGTVDSDVELRQGIFLAGSDLKQVLDAFRQISDAVAGYRKDCSVAQLQRLKRYCTELRDQCQRVSRALLGERANDGSNGERSRLPHAA